MSSVEAKASRFDFQFQGKRRKEKKDEKISILCALRPATRRKTVELMKRCRMHWNIPAAPLNALRPNCRPAQGRRPMGVRYSRPPCPTAHGRLLSWAPLRTRFHGPCCRIHMRIHVHISTSNPTRKFYNYEWLTAYSTTCRMALWRFQTHQSTCALISLFMMSHDLNPVTAAVGTNVAGRPLLAMASSAGAHLRRRMRMP